MDTTPIASSEVVAKDTRPDSTGPVPSRSLRVPLLPDSVKRPFLLFWIGVLPQLILLFLNLRAYQLVAGEMTAWQRSMSATIAGADAALLLGTVVLLAVLRARHRAISWALCWALLVAPILYLWLITYQLSSVLPSSVTTWILPAEQVLYDQFAFMMPLIFYAAMRLSSADLHVSRRVDYIVSIAIAVGLPLSFIGLARLPRAFQFLHYVPWITLTVLFIFLGLLVIGALMRLCVTVYVAFRRRGPIALGILSFLVGIAGPIGGLLLNRKIPFPADFQAAPVYVMALLNGLLLLLPNFRNPFLHRTIWLAQCLFFPFTFYFFLVFLPFLPLSFLAMLVAGAGFLVLTPTALFLVHGQRILDGYYNEIRDTGRLKPAILGLIALSVIPGWYTIQAELDRVVLGHAIDYAYSPNYRNDTRFTGNRVVLRRSLEHLRDFKAGIDLPFLSRYYNWIVFDGLVLPDEKITYLHRAFFGSDFSLETTDKNAFFGRAIQRRNWREATSSAPRDVNLVKTSANVQAEGKCDRATISLQMQNSGDRISEFVTPIHLPDGVLVSGFWLHIGNQRVPGQLFEKKTALWVYQKIRDQRRDPGLLLYTDPETLELRVFPFSPHEEREVEIEFLYPSGMKPAIGIGDQTMRPSGDVASEGVILTQTNEGEAAVWLASNTLSKAPKLTRTPYLHFIVDRSAGSDISNASLSRAIQWARVQFPNAAECLITEANYESLDLTSELKPIDSAAEVNLESLPRRGGFLPERAMKRALLRYHDALEDAPADNRWIDRFPVLVVVQSRKTEQLSDSQLSAFAKLAPDLSTYYLSIDGLELQSRSFNGKQSTEAPAIRAVTLLKRGKSIEPCAPSERSPVLIDFPASEEQSDLSAFDPITHSFVPIQVAETVTSDTRYAAGIAAWRDYFGLVYNPSRGNSGLTEIVKRSRDSGILVGSTSYIVVENSAQWNVLERKQKQKLRNSAALEIEAAAVPEPSTWCLIVLGGGLLLLLLRKRRLSNGRR
jgi:vault protein inter-alpha-trypsin-like protein/PEP-CTERM motif-containing protein